jgi:hypothetical protein
LPEQFAAGGVEGVQVAVGFAGEDETAGGGQDAANQRLLGLALPADLAAVAGRDGGQGAPVGFSSV